MKGARLIELASFAVLLQMRTGPWPVDAPAQAWAYLEGNGFVRADEGGRRILTKGYEALDARGWGEIAAPPAKAVRR
jgi:hypothetical protein